MILFRYLLYFYLLFNLFHFAFDVQHTIKGSDNSINQFDKGIGFEYVWHELSMSNDGEKKYTLSTNAQLIANYDSLGYFFSKKKSGERVSVNYNQNQIIIPLTKQQFNKLWIRSQWGLIFFRLGLIIISMLMILFLRCIQKGKMFSRKSLIILQLIGALVLIAGLLDYAGIGLLLPIIENICNIEMHGMIPQNTIHITTPFLAVVGYFILAIAFCFGRAYFLEKENALTI